MTTTAISSALLGVVNQTSSSTTSTATDTTDFLTLLLAELQNQDPTDPMDAGELTSQMASLTQVQQSVQTNDYLSTLVDYASSLNNAGAMSCIGKTVTADTSSISHASGVSDTLMFSLSDDASGATISISDEDGNVVKTITCSSLSSGNNSVTWDGTDADGNTLSNGTYTFTVAATDASGNSVTTSTTITTAVTGVSYSGSSAYLVTESGKIAYGNVTAVNAG
jgi:flagellar basal-body rod modification protein FlgD